MAKDHPTGQSGLYEAFLQLKTPEQCYRFLQDVLQKDTILLLPKSLWIFGHLSDLRECSTQA